MFYMKICDFVNFSLAIKLKEKGFREKCFATFDYVGTFSLNYEDAYSNIDLKDLLYSHNSSTNNIWVDAPTISQVLKWLREEKKIYCLPNFEQGVDMWLFCIERPQAGCEFAEYISESIYDIYEQAALAGIEYTLDNLI